MTVYSASIPQPTDLISNSQSDILGNFAQLNTQFAIDHSAFNTGSGNGTGFHKQITMPTTVAPGAQTNPQSVWHTKAGVGGVYTNYSLPFFKNQSGDLPLAPDLSSTGTNYGYQQGNLIYNFGRAEINQGSQSTTVTWKVPFTTSVLMMQMTKDGNGLGSSGNTNTCNATATSLTVGTFTSQTSLASGPMPFYYLAIGY